MKSINCQMRHLRNYGLGHALTGSKSLDERKIVHMQTPRGNAQLLLVLALGDEERVRGSRRMAEGLDELLFPVMQVAIYLGEDHGSRRLIWRMLHCSGCH